MQTGSGPGRRFSIKEALMKLFTDLFSTDYGLMSFGVIAFVVVMAIWFWVFFNRKMNETSADPK